MSISGKLNIRPATPADSASILEFIRALADYEQLAHEVVATQAQIEATLFADPPAAEVLIAQWSGKAAGFALFFSSYSTFLAKPGIFLEDLFVHPEYRGQGIGKALLTRLAAIAVERDCGRLDWNVLDWNEPAIEFYKSLGARGLDDWTQYRLDGKALHALAGQAR